MLTVQEVLDNLGLDYIDEQVTRNIERLIKVADKMLIGSLGKDYPQDDERVKESALMIIDDLYNERGINKKVSNNASRLFDSMMLQIKLEMRGKEQ